MTETGQFIDHPSVQMELKRIRELGGSVETDGNKITLFPGVIPIEILRVFCERIKKIDLEGKFEITVHTEG